jgi:ornithine cyclodeaminase/alanine dehydrogenase-like protein (mu-crystallin family)
MIPDDLSALLRVHPEPARTITEAQVHAALTAAPGQVLDHVRAGLERLARGEAELDRPSKRVFTDPDTGGDFRVMPCVVRDGASVTKTVKIVGTNLVGRRVPDQVTVGRALCLDPDENFVTHLFEACLLSSARTGICAALATERLGAERSRVAVIGAGRVGFYSALYLAEVEGVREIALADLVPDRAELAARALSARLGSDVAVRARADLAGADVVVLATTAREPLVAPRSTSASLVVSLGADARGQRELDSDWVGQADLYTDSFDSFQAGDLWAWRNAGVRVEPAAVTELVSAFGQAVPGPGRRRAFISTGSALFDNLAIRYIIAQPIDGRAQ